MGFLLSMPSIAQATIIQLSGEMTWNGFNVPAGEESAVYDFDASISFLENAEAAEIHLAVDSATWPGLTEQVDWTFLDTATSRKYVGQELVLTLGGGDFLTGDITTDFDLLVDSFQLSYYPSVVSSNFDTSLNSDVLTVSEPAAIGLLLMGWLLVLGCSFRRC